MIGLLLASALFHAATGSTQATSAPPSDEMVEVSDCRRGVEDPRAFVMATYGRYQAHPNEPPSSRQRAVYSPRLHALFVAYDDWQDQHRDLVGALDFDWWTNAQDYRIRNLELREIKESADLRWIFARFDNYDRHEEIRFRFVRQDGRWFLDDAMQGTGSGENGWTLSALLRSREE